MQTNAGNESRYLNFTLGAEFYAIPLMKVKEVMGQMATTTIPNAPSHFKGLINLRGQIISVFDLRIKLKLPKAAAGAETTIVILDMGGSQIGIVVDSVETVVTFDASDIERVDKADSMIPAQYLEGIAKKDKKLILLLDIAKTFGDVDPHKLVAHAA